MASPRRLGPQDSPTAQAILDGAERVMQKKGYGAITSRSVAEEAGVKQQLVYYYFENIDEMLLVAFKRRTARAIERLRKDAESERPPHALWDDYSSVIDARITYEYIALANHHQGIREEVISFLNESRQIQVDILNKSYKEHGVDPNIIPPEAIAFLTSCVSIMLVRESEFGVTRSHKEVRALIRRFLKQFE